MKMTIKQIGCITILLALFTVGCQTPTQNSADSVNGTERDSSWFYKGGKGTGFDPRAKEIEQRLGYD